MKQNCYDCGNEIETEKLNPVCDKCSPPQPLKIKWYKKEPIDKALRWEVWNRDNFTCKICGSKSDLVIDHIYPESKGGKATVDNCQTLCKSCNSRKGAR